MRSSPTPAGWRRSRTSRRCGTSGSTQLSRRDQREGVVRGPLHAGARPWRRQLMLCSRVIPCLDVDKGRVVKGVRIRRAARRRRSGRGRGAVRGRGRRRDRVPRHHRLARETRDDRRLVAARRPTHVHPLHRRRRGAFGRRYSARSRAGADKVSVNSAAVRARLLGELAERFGAPVRRARHRRARAAGRRGWEVFVARRPDRGRSRRRRVGARRGRARVRARSC